MTPPSSFQHFFADEGFNHHQSITHNRHFNLDAPLIICNVFLLN